MLHGNICKYVGLSVLFILVAIVSHGILGAIVPKEISFYCSISELVTGMQCPERSEPLSRAVFTSETFQTLLQSKNRLQATFLILVFIESFGHALTFDFMSKLLFLLTLSAVFVSLAAVFYLSVPPDILLRIKYRNWFRRLNQSPAIIRAYNDVALRN